MKKFEIVISEQATYKGIVEADTIEEAREEVENNFPDNFKCLDSSWNTEEVKEIKE